MAKLGHSAGEAIKNCAVAPGKDAVDSFTEFKPKISNTRNAIGSVLWAPFGTAGEAISLIGKGTLGALKTIAKIPLVPFKGGK